MVALALIAAATVGLATARLTVDQWTEYTKWIFVTYAAAKTITSSVGLASSGGTTTGDPVTPVTPRPAAVLEIRGDANPAA